jgi:hypothetical protein
MADPNGNNETVANPAGDRRTIPFGDFDAVAVGHCYSVSFG